MSGGLSAGLNTEEGADAASVLAVPGEARPIPRPRPHADKFKPQIPPRVSLMPFAAGIRFKKNSISKYYNPASLAVNVDDFVVVKDEAIGFERIGFVSILEGRATIQMGHLAKVIRKATEGEVESWYDRQVDECEMMQIARKSAAEQKLSVKISDLIFNEEKRQVLIQFTSDQRIDFRELVRDLAGKFKARIEMWQIGSRKEAGLKDGYGICGNPLCCGSWLKDFPSISMRYAKDQDIVLPPSKLSGPCGKLRCCLRYEHETYLELADGVPTRGCQGCFDDGKCGVVIDRNLLKGELVVKIQDGPVTRVAVADFEPDAPPRAVGSDGKNRGGDGVRAAKRIEGKG